jgi:hypothetical protein
MTNFLGAACSPFIAAPRRCIKLHPSLVREDASYRPSVSWGEGRGARGAGGQMGPSPFGFRCKPRHRRPDNGPASGVLNPRAFVPFGARACAGAGDRLRVSSGKPWLGLQYRRKRGAERLPFVSRRNAADRCPASPPSLTSLVPLRQRGVSACAQGRSRCVGSRVRHVFPSLLVGEGKSDGKRSGRGVTPLRARGASACSPQGGSGEIVAPPSQTN